MYMFFFLVMQKTAYEMRISDLSSDVCSSYLDADRAVARRRAADPADPCRRGDGHRPRANAAVAYRVDAVADPARCRRLSDPHRADRRGRARGRERLCRAGAGDLARRRARRRGTHARLVAVTRVAFGDDFQAFLRASLRLSRRMDSLHRNAGRSEEHTSELP